MIDISNIFKEAYKTKSPELGIISEIKSKILNYNKSEEGIKNPINDEIEIRILKNLKKEHEETLSFLKSDTDYSPSLKEWGSWDKHSLLAYFTSP